MKTIDLESWPRKKHYLYYKGFNMPHFTITANVDITVLREYVKQHQLSFFATFLYLVVSEINKQEEFRSRIRGNQVVVHELVHPSYTVLGPDDLFSFVTSEFVLDPKDFYKRVDHDVDTAKLGGNLEDDPNRDDLIYVSALPWVSFTHLTHPFDTSHVDSIPRITWGKFFQDGARWLIPVSIAVHHALCDGVHVGNFYQGLTNSIQSMK